jgi:hypothetical protein
MEENLEQKCRKAVIKIADHVKDIRYNVKDLSHKLTYFLKSYREDYYATMEKAGYRQQLRDYNH